MTIDAANIIQLIFAFHAAFFAVFVFAKAQRPAFVFLLAAFSAHMLLNFLAEGARVSWATQATFAFGFLYGPLLFLFVRELTRSDFRLTPTHAAHAIPAIAILFLPLGLSAVRVAAAVSIVVYFSFMARDIRRYAIATRQLRSDADTINLRWLVAVMAAFGGLTAIDIVRITFASRGAPAVNDVLYFLVLAAAFALINIVILRSLRQARLFSGFSGADIEAVEATAADREAEVTSDDRRAFEKLQASIVDNEYFREPRLTLQELADRLGSDARELSRLINTVAQRNFSDFVNHIRVKETKRLMALEENKGRPLLTLGLDAGFNSKSAFNNSFKKETGLTPGDYRRQLIEKKAVADSTDAPAGT